MLGVSKGLYAIKRPQQAHWVAQLNPGQPHINRNLIIELKISFSAECDKPSSARAWKMSRHDQGGLPSKPLDESPSGLF